MSDFGDDKGLEKFLGDGADDRLKPIDLQPVVTPREPQAERKAALSPAEDQTRGENTGFIVAPGEMNLVKRGDYVDLLRKDPTLKQIYVAVGWDHKFSEESSIDIDLSCFLLNRTNQTREDADFVFYNNEKAHDGAVKFKEDSRTGAGDGDDEAIFIDLNGIPFEIIKLVFALTIYDEELKGYHFGMIKSLYIRLVNRDNGEEVLRFQIESPDELAGKNAIIAANLVREGPKWFFEPLSTTSKGGLATLAKGYGIIVREETG